MGRLRGMRTRRKIEERLGSDREAVAAEFWPRTVPGPGGCQDWRGATSYGEFRGLGAHRVAVWLVTGLDPGVLDVLHSCDRPPCCASAHLSVGTHWENMQDKSRKGRARGVEVVSLAQVSEMRTLHGDGATYADLAEAFGVGRAQVGRIVCGHSRGPVETPEWRKQGHRTPNARLSDAQVAEARRRWRAGETQYALAHEYGVSLGYASALLRGLERPDAAYGVVPGGRRIAQRITDVQVEDMRSRLAAGESQAEIARTHGVAPSYVAHVKSGRYRKATVA